MEILILCVFCVVVGAVLGWAGHAAFGYRYPATWDDTGRGHDHDDQ